MNISHEVYLVINSAGRYAATKHLELITPEMFLLAMLSGSDFGRAFEECGGDVSQLKKDLEEYIEKYVDRGDNAELSAGAANALQSAGNSAFGSESPEICLRHLIHGMWQQSDSYAVYFVEKQGITEADILECMTEYAEEDDDEDEDGGVIHFTTSGRSQSEPDEDEEEDEESEGAQASGFAPCLNETLGDVNPLIGREDELERTIQILCRKDKNNPLHIGEPGVGKTAITYGLVKRLVEGKVPEPIRGAKVFALDLGGLLAGTKYRGDFEKRFKKVLKMIGREEKPIVYIDEIHNLAGAGAVGEGSFDASNMLKPYLADGKIRFIGATTFEEYKKYFEKNKSLVRRFQNVEIGEPSEAETVEILNGLRSKYEKYHGVRYSKGVIEYAVQMSNKHINERYLPDKAIDLIDEAGAYRRIHPLYEKAKGDKASQVLRKTQTVDKAVINEILTKICRVPIETVQTEETKGLAGLDRNLKSRIFGQDEAVTQVVNAVKFNKAGLGDENRPLASLLFVGPTGVGKTEIAKCLAEELGVKLIRFDMSEYGEKHTVAKLIGSPAGYVGYEEGGLLTEAVRKSPSSVLLLDEIEKAHEDIYNVLLQVMDYATLTDNQGRKADFRNVIIIMTSNAGASEIGKSSIGFGRMPFDSSVIMDNVKSTFKPEFRNRLNKIVVFNPMDDRMAAMIVDKKLAELGKMLEAKKISFAADEAARELTKTRGISAEFGAREVDRVVRNDIKPLLVDEILFGKLKKGGTVKLTVKDGEYSI